MCMLSSISIFSLIPAIVLLALSFFILRSLYKVEANGLKVFGYVIAVLLWAAVILFLTSGSQPSKPGMFMGCPLMQKMHHGQMMPRHKGQAGMDDPMGKMPMRQMREEAKTQGEDADFPPAE